MKQIKYLLAGVLFCVGCTERMSNSQMSQMTFYGNHKMLLLKLVDVQRDDNGLQISTEISNCSKDTLWICLKVDYYQNINYELRLSVNKIIVSKSQPLISKDLFLEEPIYSEYIKLLPQESVPCEIFLDESRGNISATMDDGNTPYRISDIDELLVKIGVYKLNLEETGQEIRDNNVLLNCFWNQRDKEILEVFQVKSSCLTQKFEN